MAMRSSGDVLTAPEAAAEKGVHRNSVLKAIRRGYLEARKSGKTWIIDRSSLDQWEPRGRKPASGASRPASPPRDSSASRDEEAGRKARAQEMIRLLDEWMADESGHDEEMWPRLKEVLEQDRISSRELFSETTK